MQPVWLLPLLPLFGQHLPRAPVLDLASPATPTPAFLSAPPAACDFAEPTCVIVKHTNPCGVASRDDLLEAYRLAVIADPISAFGGIVAFNRWVGQCGGVRPKELRALVGWVDGGGGGFGTLRSALRDLVRR